MQNQDDSPDGTPGAKSRVVNLGGPGPSLFKSLGMRGSGSDEGLTSALLKARDSKFPGVSDRTVPTGMKAHPFDMKMASNMVQVNPHHSACQRTLVAASVGGGLAVIEKGARPQRAEDGGMEPPPIDEDKTSELEERLDELCDLGTGHELLVNLWSDYWGPANAYLEVERGDSTEEPILGLYTMPGHEPVVHVPRSSDGMEGDPRDRFYKLLSPSGSHTALAAWRRRSSIPDSERTRGNGPPNELIHFRQPTTRSDFYGFPHWIAAAPYIETSARSLQMLSDHMFNGGVPSSALVFGGFGMTEDDQNEVINALRPGHRTSGSAAALFLPQARKDDAVIEHIKFAPDLDYAGFSQMDETNNLNIASANQVPPILAGITTPGKMAAANEQVLAMVTMHCSTVHPAQVGVCSMFHKTLFATVGGLSGFAGRKVRFRTWMESTDIKALNVVARQREQTKPGDKRDPKDGLQRG